MKKILFLLCILTLHTLAFSQEKVVKGRVIDTYQTPISGAAVVMLRLDSTFIEAAITDEQGLFEMHFESSPFQLQVSHISFETYQSQCRNNQLGDIMLVPMTLALEEVVVKAHRPMVKVEDGKLSYDLQQVSAGSTATNAFEALQRLPGVDEKDGMLQLAGMGHVTVILNGKPTSMNPTQLKTILQAMPIDRIKSAEILYSAPPQYGIRGAAINLVTQKNRDYTYAGEVRAGYKHQHLNSGDAGGSFITSTPKWTTDVLYDYDRYHTPKQNKLSTIHTVEGITRHISQKDDTRTQSSVHTMRSALEYSPNEKNTYSLTYNGSLTPHADALAESDGTYVKSTSKRIDDKKMHNLSFRYKRKESFDMGMDYTFFKSKSHGRLENLYTDLTNTSFNINSGQKVSRIVTYADKQHKLGKGWGVTYGTKVTWAEDRDYQRYSQIEGETNTFDTDSRLTEWNAELYTGFSKNLRKGSISASITGEYYNLQGDQQWMLYPQANFMWMFDQAHILQASISSDKTYPTYWMLQNAISYLDGYTEIHGNPSLRPTRSYSAQLSYILHQKYIFTLFGSNKVDYFAQNAYLAPDRYALIYKFINFDYSRQYGINLIVPFSIGEWFESKVTLVGLRMEDHCDDFFGQSFHHAAWVGIARMDNTFRLSENLSFEVNGSYQSPAVQGIFDIKQSWALDAGLKLSLLKKRLTLTAKCQDIFESLMPEVTQNFAGQQLHMYTGGYNRSFSINLSYTFGGYTKKEQKKVDDSRFGH